MGPSCGLSASWAGRESTLSHLAAGDWNMLRNPHLVIRKYKSRPRAAAQEDSWWETGGKFPSGRFHRSFTLSEMHYLIRYINGTSSAHLHWCKHAWTVYSLYDTYICFLLQVQWLILLSLHIFLHILCFNNSRKLLLYIHLYVLSGFTH